ncbi:hypothetical protein ACN2EN_05270 [Aliarcobacter lanthieri]|uniref:hypothetical protein n=1 Tax=Aliarcobacter TaxID=2321111 RepID=UPI001EDB5F9B|nr:hypothetical protein [Aliarcobacter butzleri]MCG3655903.1 hypothetical protein [Aliarcobacter butzleri]MCT7581567.1 hypothetical protein [Aliarcobacter butzleri]
MNTNITINGTVMAVVEKEYNSEKTVYAQFLKEDSKKGFEVIKIKMTIQSDYSKLQQNQVVSIPVNIATVNGNMYFSQNSELKVLKEQTK